MSTFLEDLQIIESAVYGKDMRAAIHDALLKLSDRRVGRDLTLEEYESLPIEEKYNGSLYFITDKGYIIKDGTIYGSGGGYVASTLAYSFPDLSVSVNTGIPIEINE